MSSTTVLIIEDQRAFADTLALAISLEADLDCLGSAHTAASGIDLAEERRPDVVLLDLGLPDRNGLDVVGDIRVRCPDTSVIVLTARADSSVLADVTRARADGFSAKGATLHSLFDMVRSAPRGGKTTTISNDAFAVIDRAPTGTHPGVLTDLTARELEVLRLLHRGHRVTQIAGMLHMSIHTGRDHVKRILAKLDAHSQLEAVARARELGLLDAD